MKTTLHLVRHGQVENPGGVIYGRLPGYHLSKRGHAQAAAAADRLAGADLAVVVASPLERAQETAAEIAARHGLEVKTDERLIESGTTLEGVGRTLRTFAISPRHWWSLRNPWKPSWGESFGEIKERMLAAIGDWMGLAAGRELAIVTHQSPVLVARLALTRRRLPPWPQLTRCETGSITTLVLEDDRVVSASYFSPRDVA